MRASVNRLLVAFLAGCVASGSPAARAENQMGYQLQDPRAARLPPGGGALGMNVRRGQVIKDSGLVFELLEVQSVRRGFPAARSGLAVGDQIIAVNGRVFPGVAAFAGYVGSLSPGQTIAVDYLPRGGGPEQAQRIGVTLAEGGNGLSRQPAPDQESHGLSTGQKLAIGAGAVALFGCYKMGCLNRSVQPNSR
jgi:S1-C subfamily serine protease